MKILIVVRVGCDKIRRDHHSKLRLLFLVRKLWCVSMPEGFDKTSWGRDANVRLIFVKSNIFASRKIPESLFVTLGVFPEKTFTCVMCNRQVDLNHSTMRPFGHSKWLRVVCRSVTLCSNPVCLRL